MGKKEEEFMEIEIGYLHIDTSYLFIELKWNNSVNIIRVGFDLTNSKQLMIKINHSREIVGSFQPNMNILLIHKDLAVIKKENKAWIGIWNFKLERFLHTFKVNAQFGIPYADSEFIIIDHKCQIWKINTDWTMTKALWNLEDIRIIHKMMQLNNKEFIVLGQLKFYNNIEYTIRNQ